jgi:SHS2 domain-containing protein
VRPLFRSEEHIGEWKLSLWADTLEEIFSLGAVVIGRECGPTAGDPGEWLPVGLEAADPAALLVDWLNELLGLSEIHGRALVEVRGLALSRTRVNAQVRGPRVTEWRSPLKAATYHGLALSRQGDRWRAVVLFDV